eukprot:3675013-Prymnesium_polylepis.1
MAPDATVLVAPRRRSRCLHRSFDGDGVLGRRTDASDTSAARSASNSGSSWLVWRSSSLRRFRH